MLMLGDRYNEHTVKTLGEDIVTALACNVVFSCTSLWGMPSFTKIETPPQALPPIS